MEFKEILRTLRKSKKLTQEKLGKEIGVSAITIRSYEAGRREPNSETLVKLENYFKVSGAYLRGEVNDPKIETIWNVPEISETVDNELQTLLIDIVNNSLGSSNKNKKMLFDILVELRHVLKLKNEKHKELTLDTLQTSIFSITRFVDIYNSSLRKESFEIGRLVRAKESAVMSLSKSLEDMIELVKKND